MDMWGLAMSTAIPPSPCFIHISHFSSYLHVNPRGHPLQHWGWPAKSRSSRLSIILPHIIAKLSCLPASKWPACWRKGQMKVLPLCSCSSRHAGVEWQITDRLWNCSQLFDMWMWLQVLTELKAQRHSTLSVADMGFRRVASKNIIAKHCQGFGALISAASRVQPTVYDTFSTTESNNEAARWHL